MKTHSDRKTCKHDNNNESLMFFFVENNVFAAELGSNKTFAAGFYF